MMCVSWKTFAGAALSLSLVGAFSAPVARAAELTEIKISYQPAVYWALPFYVATQKGWWAEVGLKPKFSVFPAGVPQMAASASKSWDVGSAGSVPSILGFQRFGILLIGISNDESAANDLMVTKAAAAEYKKNPKAIKGQSIALTANSTGDYAVQSCLKKFGVGKNEVTIRSMGQSEIMSAMSSGNIALGGLWAPNTYTMEEKAGSELLCSGKDAGVVIPGALLVRGAYAKEHPENVAKFLAVYERGWKWANAHRKEAVAMLKKFYAEGGVNISESAMNKEFDTRPVFDLAGQLKVLDRSKGQSEADQWFTKIAEFMKGTGSIQAVPNAKNYLTDKYFKMVKANPKLSAFANKAD